MASKRKSSGSSISGPTSSATMKFNRSNQSFSYTSLSASSLNPPKGTKPLPGPVTIPEIFTKVLTHCCKKYLYIDIKIRLLTYAVLLFFVSLVTDYTTVPRSYFSYSSNVFNQLFVKYSWGWTFSLVGLYLYLSVSVLCCGRREWLWRHLSRLGIGTLVWFIWTNLFRIIEETSGQCLGGGSSSNSEGRRACLKAGGKWASFDISGHSFLLIWCVLFIIEESRSIVGWDSIGDHLRNEEHKRGPKATESCPETPLSSLSDEDFEELKALYPKYNVPIKLVLFGMTGLAAIWDLMILMTAIYFHSMIEKVIGGFFGVACWFFLYRILYPGMRTNFGMPGFGMFRYGGESGAAFTSSSSSGTSAAVSSSKSKESQIKTTGAGEEIPKFMGMPLVALKNRNQNPTVKEDQASTSTKPTPTTSQHSSTTVRT